jgi:hypothetical protein
MLNERAEAAEREVERLKAERDKYGWAPVQSHEGWKQRADLAENDARLTKLERDKAETALAEARREWANDTEALNALRAENERLHDFVQSAATSHEDRLISRLVTAPDADDLERLGFIAFRKAQNGLHAHEGAAFASQFLAAIADVAKSKSAEVGS